MVKKFVFILYFLKLYLNIDPPYLNLISDDCFTCYIETNSIIYTGIRLHNIVDEIQNLIYFIAIPRSNVSRTSDFNYLKNIFIPGTSNSIIYLYTIL